MRKTSVSEWLFFVPLLLAQTDRRVRSSMRRKSSVSAITAYLVLAASSFTPTFAGAQDTLTVLHKFGGANADDPDSLIQASDGNFYGTTYLGKSSIFQITPSGQFTLLFTAPYNPNGTNQYPDGNNYTDIVEGPDGFLYVVASSGAQSSNVAQPGTLIRISKSGTGYEVVHRFCSAPNCTDGAMAWKLVLGSDGNFYGAAGHGGSFTCYLGCGTIFRLSTNGTYTVLYSPVQGQTGVGALNLAADGNFYALCSPPISGPPSVCRVTTSGQVTPIFQFPSGRWPANVYLTQGSDGFLYGVDGPPSTISYQVIFQLSTSGSYREIYQINAYCTAKTGCSRVMQASDGNLWIADPPQEAVYSITKGGVLLQTVPFSSQQNPYAHPQLLIQASSGILYGTTGEPNPAFYDFGSVFSLDAGLPPPR